ncbi:MAG: MBL fold metallo-hydrolase [Candidatus Andersenbacteria bacterium]|nr:MBL fold metallo-hydrolase [bacterium]MDZ4225244.1 MBL fold metallo-hydrolase [Candidatus Andersenbacteria bacterium]
MNKLARGLIKDFLVLLVIVLICVGYYLYMPRSAVRLHERIAATDPNVLTEERVELSRDLEKYLAVWLPRDTGKTPTLLHLFLGNQRKFFDLSLGQAIDDIDQTAVAPGKMRIWSFMNMGAVVKTSNKAIAFDTADMPESVVQKRLADIADIFLVTHADMDHYNPTLLKKALQNGKSAVFPEGFRFMYESENWSNIYYLKDGQPVDINGVKITALQTDHRVDGNFNEPNAWYLVETDGFKILHTGDGINFKYKNEKAALAHSGVDVFLCNVKVAAYDIRDISPKVVVPMHLFKFMSNREELENSTFDYAENIYRQYPGELKGIDIKLLFPGEGFEYEA